MATTKPRPGYSVNNQHDYVTLRTPYGNYTTSYGGEKLGGLLMDVPDAMGRITRRMMDTATVGGKTDRAAALARIAVEFESLLPEVLSLPAAEAVAQGDTVAVTGTLKKRYPGEYRVGKVKQKYAYVELPGGLMGLPIERLTVTKHA